ncbi:MAG: hypothetical protein IIC49_07965 [Planctomycetes bacterium]|nr:hypothetical protein [Planctomycetota bacterium]
MNGPSDGWRRFRKNRGARAGLVTLAVLAGLGLAALPFSLRWYNVQELGDAVRHAPSVTPVVPIDRYLAELDRACGRADPSTRGLGAPDVVASGS